MSKGVCPFCYGELQRELTEDTSIGTKVIFTCPDVANAHEESETTQFYVYVDFSNLEY
jgi:hypothetical protein